MELLLYNILLILNLIPIFLSSKCSSITNCFKCNSISNNVCKWDEYKCIDYESSSENLTTRLLKCYENSDNLYFIYQYCGNTDLFLVDKDIKIKLPKNNGLYGFDNIYCRYTILNSKGASQKFYVKIKQNINLSPSFLLIIGSNNDNYMRIINEEKISFEIKDIIEIYIDYYSTSSYSKNPIEITISFNKFLSLQMILLICLIFIIIVFVLVIIFLYINKICFNSNLNQQNKKKKEEERKNAEYLFSKIKFFLFNDYNNKEKNNNCIICFENYNPEDKLIIIKCGHIFHYDCLKKWFIPLNSTEVNNSCPECRNELFDLKNIDNNNLEEINNNLNLNNQNQEIQNNNLNLNNNQNQEIQNNNLNLNDNNQKEQNNNLNSNNNQNQEIQNNNLNHNNNNQNEQNDNNNNIQGPNFITIYNESLRSMK